MMKNSHFFKKSNVISYCIKMIPNLITVSRIIMTLFIIYFLESDQGTDKIFLSINVLIFISDFFDGKIARYLKATSCIGEVLDVSADMFYVFSISILMSFKDIIPFYYILIVITEFLVFIITSKYMKQHTRYLVFDMLGRILAALYYILPTIMFVYCKQSEILHSLFYKYGFYIIGFLTFGVITYRVRLCIKK